MKRTEGASQARGAPETVGQNEKSNTCRPPESF
jgi:hypothetical protein